MGKTAIALKTFMVLRSKGKVKSALVVAPLRPAFSVWSKEMPRSESNKWHEFRNLRVEMLHGPDKDAALEREADLYVINPEGLQWLVAARKRVKRRWDLLIVDESTKFKRSNTKRFKLLRQLLGTIPRRWILTGTPRPQGLEDLFGQIYILDEGKALGRYITHYRNYYFYPTGYGGYTYMPFDWAEDAIYEKLRPLVLRMASEDYQTLPPLIENEVWLELPDDVKPVYEQVEKDLFVDLDEGNVVASTAGVASMKCRQIAAGGVFYTESRQRERWEQLHLVKAEATLEILEELQGQPALIAYYFEHDLERLRKVLGKDVPHLGGGVSKQQAAMIENAWNAGDLPALMVQPGSAAHGLNLQETGRAIIWHSPTWDLEHYIQLIHRLWRKGQQHRVVNHRLIMSGTIEEAMYRGLGKKNRGQQSMFDALKDYRKSRR